MERVKWTLIGALLIGGAYGVAYTLSDSEIWLSYLFALLGGLFCLGLMLWKAKSSGPYGLYPVDVTLIVLMAGAIAFTSVAFWVQSTFMQDNLAQIRTSIDRGIALIEFHEPVMATLSKAYPEADAEEAAGANLAGAFRQSYGEQLQGGDRITGLMVDDEEETSMHYYIDRLQPDRVELVAQAEFNEGRDTEFENVGGTTGLLQIRAIITGEGVSYVFEN